MKQRFKHNGILLEVTGKATKGKSCAGCLGESDSFINCRDLPQCTSDTRADGKDYIWTGVRVVAEKGDGK